MSQLLCQTVVLRVWKKKEEGDAQFLGKLERDCEVFKPARAAAQLALVDLARRLLAPFVGHQPCLFPGQAPAQALPLKLVPVRSFTIRFRFSTIAVR